MKIVFEDKNIIVVNKPAGLLSVPGRGIEKLDSVETRIKAQYAGAVAVHRLDMATSGIMLLAKHKAAERHYKSCFEQRKSEKVYQAICHGILADKKGEIDLPLRCDWDNRPRQMVCYTHGKHALTRYEVLEEMENRTRIALYPVTGRSHQLRVHLASIGHPIIGDKLYSYPEDKNLPRLLLHAQSLSLPTPENQWQTFEVATPF